MPSEWCPNNPILIILSSNDMSARADEGRVIMKFAGMIVGSIGLQTSAAAAILYVSNLAVWSILTGLLGGSMALIGLGLVMWALYPIRGEDGAQVSDKDEPVLAGAQPEPA